MQDYTSEAGEAVHFLIKYISEIKLRCDSQLQQASACVDAAALLASPQQQQCPVVGLRMCWCKGGT